MQLPDRREIQRAQLGMQVQNLTALLAAVLMQTGRVTLTKKEAETIYQNPEIHYERNGVDGSMAIWVTYKSSVMGPTGEQLEISDQAKDN